MTTKLFHVLKSINMLKIIGLELALNTNQSINQSEMTYYKSTTIFYTCIDHVFFFKIFFNEVIGYSISLTIISVYKYT